MSLQPALSASEPAAGRHFHQAVADVRARLDAATATAPSAAEDPLAHNVLLNFRVAFNAFYDAFVRRHGLADTDDDDDDDEYDQGRDEDEDSVSQDLTGNSAGYDDDEGDDEDDSSWTETDRAAGYTTHHATAADAAAGMQCAVCITLFASGDALHRMSCGHVYHADCAARWLQCNPSCPLCKRVLE